MIGCLSSGSVPVHLQMRCWNDSSRCRGDYKEDNDDSESELSEDEDLCHVDIQQSNF